jgi:hypothetical protein
MDFTFKLMFNFLSALDLVNIIILFCLDFFLLILKCWDIVLLCETLYQNNQKEIESSTFSTEDVSKILYINCLNTGSCT